MTHEILNSQLVELMFTLSRSLKEEMTFDSETSQLTVMQLQALIFVSKNNIVSMGDIANKFKIALPTATVLSDKLVNADLIVRNRSKEDRRMVTISLTKKGESLLKEAVKQRQLKMNKMLSYLSVEDREQLLHILKNLSVNIQKSYEK